MNVIKAMFLFIFCLSCVSCTPAGRKYVMKAPDMYIVPNLQVLPGESSVLFSVLNPVLDLSEGGECRKSWPSVLITPDGEKIKIISVDLGNRHAETGLKLLCTLIPKSIKDCRDCYFGVFSRTGSRVYDVSGKSSKIKKMWKHLNPGEYDSYFTKIESDSKFIVGLDSKLLDDLTAVYKEFRVRELNWARDYTYNKYGTSLDEKQLDQIVYNDTIVASFVEWLGKDWHIYLTAPFMNIGSTAIVAGVVKVVTLPSIWGDKINKPGYMEYIPDAESTAKMILRGIQEYGPSILNGGAQ